MKQSLVLTPLVVTLMILASTLVTYQIFSYYNPAVQASEDANPTVTLILPDQEYMISTRDLANLVSDLMIPSRDSVIPKIRYDQNEGIIKAVESPRDYVISLEDLRTQAATGELSFTPTYILQERLAGDLSSYNLQLNKVYRSPLSISLKDGNAQADLLLDSAVLRSLLVPSSIELNVPPDINKSALLTYLTSRLTPNQKKYFSPEAAYQNTKLAVNARFMGGSTPTVLGVDDGPSSSGELGQKYLEVDLSQQKMYFFIDHALYKEYRISTGFEYPTPVGEFHILNKAPKAFSDIYNVWMPYWMGFKYAGDVGAYLGIHEIAYAVDPKGKPIYRHGYYIGEMMTGGCVAMEPKDSREIYNLSEVGMLVRVVK